MFNYETQNLAFCPVEFQRQERTKSNQIKKQLLNPQEKVYIIIKFKPPTFVLPTPKDIVLPKKNHPTSPSNLGFPSFLPKKNLFPLSKTNPTCLKKRNFFTLPFLYSSSSLQAVTTISTVDTDDAIANASITGSEVRVEVVVTTPLGIEDRQAFAATCQMIRSVVGKRIGTAVENGATAVSAIGTNSTDVAPFFSATAAASFVVSALTGKLSPFTTACGEDNACKY